jgi:hypothetical protein
MSCITVEAQFTEVYGECFHMFSVEAIGPVWILIAVSKNKIMGTAGKKFILREVTETSALSVFEENYAVRRTQFYTCQKAITRSLMELNTY